MSYVSNDGSTWGNFPSTGPIIKLADESHWNSEQENGRKSMNSSYSHGSSAHSYAPTPRPFASSAERRLEAIHTLQKAGMAVRLAALFDLQEALEDDDEVVRVAAVETLGTLGDHMPVGTLMHALIDPSWNVRAAAAQALGHLGDRTPIKHLVTVLKQEQDENVREAIIRALGRQGRAMPHDTVISALLYDKNWLVREAAAWALGELGENAPISHLIDALQRDPDESVRTAAARSLGQSLVPGAEPPLLEALYDPDEDVQVAAAWALQQLDEETRGIQEWGQIYTFCSSASSLFEEIASSISLVNWEYTPKGQAFLALTEFMSDKKGWVREANVLETQQGLVLVIDCFYQNTGRSLQETVLRSLKHSELVRPLEAAFNDRDEVVQEAVKQAFEVRERRSWRDLLIVSFEFLSSSDGMQQAPLRVIVSGMGCQWVRENDTSVLNQIVDAWIDSVEEPLVYQHPHDLADLKIWYQPAPNQPEQQRRAS